MKKTRIMVVDDEPAVLSISGQILERLGYEVEIYSCAIDAFASFERDPQGFDLVITDRTMPSMTGEELTGRILQVRPEMTVIVCSGRDGDGKAGKADGYRTLRKPVRLRELEDAVQRALDEKCLLAPSA
jgi:two-component system, cell cycle sensor histidine kinase and response regulator CckA